MRISGKRQILSLAAICAVVVMVATAVRAQSDASGLYKSKCQVCHGPDGSGDTVMGKKLGVRDLRSAEVQKQTDAQLKEIIVKGKDKMQGFARRLTPGQVKLLVSYMRGLKSK